jgi:uncharacterized membrane protein
MKKRPKLVIEKSTSDKLIELINWLLLMAIWMIPILAYADLPDEIPMRFDSLGNVSTSGKKVTLFLLPIIGTFTFLLIYIIGKYPHTHNYMVTITEENAPDYYTISTKMLRYVNLSICLTFLIIMHQIIEIATNGTNSLGGWFILLLILIVFAPIAYFFRKSIMLKST